MSKITIPGLIDPHVHLRGPGQTEKEDFYTGTCAALAGGYTTVIDMPNNKTPITTLERLEKKIADAKEKIVCDIGFHFGSRGENIKEFEKVKGLVKGLKLYLDETTGNFTIEENFDEVFEYWPQILPILVHAEEKKVEKVLSLAKRWGKRVHFCHISLQSELEMITKAKEEDLAVTCGVTPHHLFLTDADEKYLGPYALMKPRLKKRSDVDYLWNHMNAIDIIESDHAPHTLQEKDGQNPPYGVPGLETTLPLLLSAVSEKKMNVDDIVRLCHDGPADIFNIPNNDSSVEIDLHSSFIIRNSSLHTKAKWSPFDGWKIPGSIIQVQLRGKTVFEDGQILATPGQGHILK